MNSIRGIDNHERLDEELYQDFETDEARKVQRYDMLFMPEKYLLIDTPYRKDWLEKQRSWRSWKKHLARCCLFS